MARSGDLTTEMPFEHTKVFVAACRALPSLRMAVHTARPHAGYIKASTPLELATLGENIDITVRPSSPTTTTFRLHSSLKLGLDDWGRIRRDLRRIVDTTFDLLWSHPELLTERPARWHADPSARHERRYWNGERWTAFVADGSQVRIDPL